MNLSSSAFVAFGLTVLLTAPLVGCGNDGAGGSPSPVPATPTPQATATATSRATATAPPTATPPATSTPTSRVQCFDTTVDATLCDPAVATFTLASTNRYYPLHVGLRTVLEGEEDGALVRVERTVLEETETVAGVETHVLEHKNFIDGQIHEIARNFYVEATDGTVCYFGEDVDFYEDGVLVNTAGAWKAGVNGAKPGVIMPASPSVGDAYFQERAPGIAIDMGRVSATGVSRTIGGVTYNDLVVIQDSNPLEGCGEEEKVYAPGIGEVADTFLELISVTGAPVLSKAKLLVEHSATGEDTGFQGFADGDPWNELTISGPGGVEIVKVTPAGGLFNFGLTELFF